MKKENLYLIAGVLTLITFIGFMTETEGKDMFGYTVNIWVYRVAWLIITVSCFSNYYKLKKSAK